MRARALRRPGCRPSAAPASSSVARGAASTFIAFCVVLRSVIWARNWSSSRTSGGRPLMICRSCVAWIDVWPVPNRPVPASATATIRKVVSASLSGTVTVAWPLASSTTRRVPQQQGVEQLARLALAAAAAGRHGLAAVVPAADDFHLRGRGAHAPAAPLQHRFEQVPAVVGHQLQQRLVDRGQRHLGAGGGLAVGQLGR